MILHDIEISVNCRKVRVFAAELGIPLQLAPVDPMKGENRYPDYLAKNPNGKVPTIVDDGFVLWESGAILCYMAAKAGKYLPTDVKGRAIVDQWMQWWCAHLEAALHTLAMERWIKPVLFQAPGNDPTICGEAEKQVARFLPVLDEQLGKTEYVTGELSVVDFLIAPVLDRATRFGTSYDGTPNVAAWLERMKARPSWKTP